VLASSSGQILQLFEEMVTLIVGRLSENIPIGIIK